LNHASTRGASMPSGASLISARSICGPGAALRLESPAVAGTSRLLLGALAFAAIVVSADELSEPAYSQEPEPPAAAALVATTASHAELVETIPVSGSPGAAPRVVMSLGPGQLPDLQEGDRLRASAEVQITADCTFHRPRCAGPPYHYSPALDARLVLADGEQVTGGANAISLSAPDTNVCHNSTGDREHHCMLVPRGAIEIGGGDALPCNPESCHVNLVVEAHDSAAGPGDVMVVGGQRPNGAVLQDKGRINVVRTRNGADEQATTLSTSARVHAALPLNLSKQVVYSQKLEGLQDREQLEVEATMITQISQLPYATRVGARLILAKGRKATGQGRQVKEIADFNGEIAENNGFNCTQAESPCLTRKVGVLKMKKDASGPLYVNLVVITGPKNRPAGPGDHVKIGASGGLSVTRFGPGLFG
jgi:hypothetical protein